ncbi:MAG: hypothetical protein U0802_17995 [Candidatus Binatia bacterium]
MMTRRWGVAVATAALVALIAAAARSDDGVRDGAAITPQFAQSLYERVGHLQAADGCAQTRFDTGRYRIVIGLRAPSGAEHVLEIATAPDLVPVAHRVGDWAVGRPAELIRDCPATVAAIEQVLTDTAAPAAEWHIGAESYRGPSPYALLVVSFALLVVGTLWVLVRETVRRRPPLPAVLALVAIWLVALGLRWWVSPRTFLHEYYHIAETVVASLSGEVTAGYGRTGPALFRAAGLLLGTPDDPHVIFMTNAVLTSLVVPAAALLVLAAIGSWPQALCAAVLFAVWPQILRYSAAEDLFVQATTFGLWALALFALHLNTRRVGDALLAALAVSLAVQARPEMIFFPVVVLAFAVCTSPRDWRLLLSWRVLLALAVRVALLVPHLLDVLDAMRQQRAPRSRLPYLPRWFETLVLLQSSITPLLYRLLVVAGAIWALRHRRGWLLWAAAVFVGYTLFTNSIFDNPPYCLRSQILPTAFAILIAAGSASIWMDAWGTDRRRAVALGAGLLAALSAWVLIGWHGFVTELFDQQLEYAFLERTVPGLPDKGALLTAVEPGGSNLDAFPAFLLQRARKRYDLVDVRGTARGDVAWPEAGEELLFYQGMFCYFAFDDEPSPDPMTPFCQAVHERYAAEPLAIEDLRTKGYSTLRYAQGGDGTYRIGFYRLRPRR